MVLDVHSHIVPKVDDGSDSVRESIGILQLLQKQGVDKVVATPHFYADKYPIDQYLEMVSQQYVRLCQETQGMQLPETFLGFEVHYFKGISSFQKLESLCMQSSRFILVEFPYTKINRRMLDEVTDMAINRNLVPIIAHIDRYLKYNSLEELISIFDDGFFMGQLNADSFLQMMNKKKAFAFLESKCCQFIGSDVHNLTTRAPHIDKAMEYIEKKLGWQYVNYIDRQSTFLYQELTKKSSN